MVSFTQVRAERLRRFQDPENHIGHNITMIDCMNDKVFDIQWCDDCKSVLMSPDID
jgi:hypothetical protein